MVIEKILIALIIFTSSFDLIGVVEIGDQTIRFSLIFVLLGIVVMLYKLLKNFKKQKKVHNNIITITKCDKYLLVWLLFQLVFSLLSENIELSVAYFIWTCLCVSILFLFENNIKTEEEFKNILRVYIFTFTVMSVEGIIQFILSLFGINLFISQESLNGIKVARVNGFTFEPSYYSTYLLPGWILSMYLSENKSEILTHKEIKYSPYIITSALILSTSRMGWICMAIWFAYRLYIVLVRNRDRDHFNFLLKHLLFIFVIFTIYSSIVYIYSTSNNVNYSNSDSVEDFSYIESLIDGMGLPGTSDYSSGVRIRRMIRTFGMFLDSPIIGYSIGGLAFAYCKKYNIPFDSGETMCTWIEVLAASGIIGIIPFILWGISVIKPFFKNNKYVNRNKYEIYGMFYALIFELIISTFNQNILRIYYWVLLGLYCSMNNIYLNDGSKETDKIGPEDDI